MSLKLCDLIALLGNSCCLNHNKKEIFASTTTTQINYGLHTEQCSNQSVINDLALSHASAVFGIELNLNKLPSLCNSSVYSSQWWCISE